MTEKKKNSTWNIWSDAGNSESTGTVLKNSQFKPSPHDSAVPFPRSFQLRTENTCQLVTFYGDHMYIHPHSFWLQPDALTSQLPKYHKDKRFNGTSMGGSLFQKKLCKFSMSSAFFREQQREKTLAAKGGRTAGSLPAETADPFEASPGNLDGTSFSDEKLQAGDLTT